MGQTQAGHTFLAELGKKRLRPGGVEATNWLIEQGEFSQEAQVLEVACNMCTTSIELVKEYRCHITGIDLDKQALKQAEKNIRKADLSTYIQIVQGNALKLPFEDASFDIVLNEAMLTMLNDKAKAKALKEYYRVLKPGGQLLTHDISYMNRSMEPKLNELRDTININVAPLQRDDWKKLFLDSGFTEVKSKGGPMSLMSPVGMLRDEGCWNTGKIIFNGMKKENRTRFKQMMRFFNKSGKELDYIAVSSRK